jgi:23S rRNA (adenine2503-C2)-methyltransferase
MRIESCFTSTDGTQRFLLGLGDGESIESVLIPRPDRVTLCISSQAGCGLGCTFCLTGQLGFIRDLSSDEIISQVRLMLEENSAQRYSVVFMGMGEPLQNYDSVMQAIRFMHDDHGLALPMSRITISTAGLIPAMERLAAEPLFPNLCISLTGVTNAVRDVLMPVNRKYPIESIMEVVRKLPLSRQKRVMFECVMIKGVTDSAEDARALAALVQGLRVKINLIPLNPAEEVPFDRADTESILRYQAILLDHGVATFVRKNRGNDVSSACGQLKGNSHKEAQKAQRS